MSKSKKKCKATTTCDNCANCLYIGEGDYACMAGDEPTIVMEEHIPNENYCRCDGELWKKE